MSGLLENLYYPVKRHAMPAVRESRIKVRIQGTSGSKGVTLDAWNLYKPANRVTSHAKMMFQSHFRSILYL